MRFIIIDPLSFQSVGIEADNCHLDKDFCKSWEKCFHVSRSFLQERLADIGVTMNLAKQNFIATTIKDGRVGTTSEVFTFPNEPEVHFKF